MIPDDLVVYLICGSRTWRNRILIYETLRMLTEHHGRERLVIMHGDHHEGADAMARNICESQGIQQIKVPAAWKGFGRKAGPRRNRLMLGFIVRPKLVIGFRNEGQSDGTDDMLTAAIEASIPRAQYGPHDSIEEVRRDLNHFWAYWEKK